MKQITAGQIVPYGLCRRTWEDDGFTEYLLRLPVLVWWRTGDEFWRRSAYTGWWALNLGAVLGRRPRVFVFWSVLR